jgi:putative transposase
MFGVEPICRVLQVAPSSYYAWKSRRPSARAVRDERLKAAILGAWEASRKVYGARKMWLQLHRDGTVVARCTVERLMRALGLAGAVRGSRKKTTTAAAAAAWPADQLDRDFTAGGPDRRWVADITYIPLARGGFAYAAFITDLFSRKIVGWKVAGSLAASLALDALEMAVFGRGGGQLAGLVHHSDRGSQYLSVAYTTRLEQAGAIASVGSKGDSYDNAVAESLNGLYKTELIRRDGPWDTVTAVEAATASYVHWFNGQRLHGACGGVPPAEYEQAWRDRQQQSPASAGGTG